MKYALGGSVARTYKQLQNGEMKLLSAKAIEKFSVTHVSIPVEIFSWFITGFLNAKELLLVCIIDNMVDRFGRGCIASNGYLGRMVRLSPNEVSKVITQLKRKGVLYHAGYYKRRRTLETAWSRNPLLRDQMKQRLERIAKSDNLRLGKNPKPALGKTPNPYDILTKVSRKKDRKESHHPVKFTFSEKTEVQGNFSYWCCQLLKDTLHKQGFTAEWKNSNQIKHFKFLTNKLGKEVVIDVLEWYCTNLKKIKKPLCTSPKQFRTCWDWIKGKYDKFPAKEEKVEVTEEARALAKSLGTLHWPKGSKEQLPVAIQQSIDNYRGFRTRLHKYLGTLENDKSRWKNYVDYIDKAMAKTSSFVGQWFRDLNRSVQSWRGWSGELANHILTVEHKDFIAKGQHVTVLYGCRAKDFNKLVEELYATKG